jgi:hypothetical protein
MGKLSKFQMQPFYSWKGLTADNHIAALGQAAPQKATNLMVNLLAFHNGYSSLESQLLQLPTKEFESDDEFYWDVLASSRRNIPLVDARTLDGTSLDEGDSFGANGEPFYLVFAEDWFALGEVIHGSLNEVYPIRILENGREEGSNTVYKVSLMGNVESGIPAERLRVGERFSVGYAPAEAEGSRKMGDVRFSAPVSMRNEFSRVRIQHKVWGNKMDKKLAFGIPMTKVVDGKQVKDTATMWMHYAEWALEQQFQEYKDNVLMFGVSNRNSNGEYTDFGFSGNVLKMGDGLRVQCSAANVIYYNKFSLKVLEDAIYDLLRNDSTGTKITIRTGMKGAMLIHKAIDNEVSGWSKFVLDGAAAGVVRKTSSPLHQNALSAGYMFVEYQSPMGAIINIQVDKSYDDPVRNKVMHPDGGVAESYRMDIFELGTAEQPNIMKCTVKGQGEIRGFQSGFRNPYTGQVNINQMSYDEDSAVAHRMATLGVCVLDPTRTLSLIPAILQA